MEYKLGELFCGPGGLALGALNSSVIDKSGQEHRILHSWANDYHEDTCNTYRNNICPNNRNSVISGDVKDLDISLLDQIDGFAYGFPCNDFSNVGESKGLDGKFGPLYSYGVNVLNHFKPKFFVAENVGGLGSSKQKKAFEKIRKELSEAGGGYEITTHLYKSEKYGVPQNRHRIIIVGLHKSLGKTFRVPSPIFEEETRYITASMALEEPPIKYNAPNNEYTNQSKKVIERLKHIKPGENAWTANLPADLELNVKGAKISQIYKRLHPNKPAYTLTGSGGGGTHGYHWSEHRALTNRERARLQTFPDSFIFSGSKESVRRQIGMAVPPKLSEVIFTALLKTLAEIPYDYIEPSFKNVSRPY